MRQSTRQPSPVMTSRVLAGAVAFALGLGSGALRAEGGDGAGAATDAVAARPAAQAGTELRPRWIEPRRGDESSPLEAAPVRDWQSGARVIVHAVPAEARLAAAVEGMLERLGAEEIERRVVDTSASTDQVRFFHAEDARMARELAAALEPLFGVVRVRDLTFYRPLPESGALEVWLR